jgi:hypothetical protein
VLRRALLLALAPLLALSVSAAPVQAASWAGYDPTGDARALSFDPEPAPCGTMTDDPSTTGDIRRLGVSHRAHRVRITVRVNGLGELRDTYITLPLRTPRRDLEVDVDLRPSGRVRASLSTATEWSEPGDPDECGNYYVVGGSGGVECRGIVATTDTGGDRIAVDVPRSCLGAPRWVRAGAEVQGNDTDGGVTFIDRWEPDGTGDGDFLTPTYGARVLAPASAR